MFDLVCLSVCLSLTLKVNVNFLLPNERENVLVSSVLRGNTTARWQRPGGVCVGCVLAEVVRGAPEGEGGLVGLL